MLFLNIIKFCRAQRATTHLFEVAVDRALNYLLSCHKSTSFLAVPMVKFNGDHAHML